MKSGRRKEIESLMDNKLHGMKNYYLRFVADEVTDYITKESADGVSFTNTKEIRDSYDLSEPELMKVLVMMKMDKLHFSKLGLIPLYHDLQTKLNMENYKDFKLETHFLEEPLYDQEHQGIFLIGKSWLHNLVYSTAQASKIYRDILFRVRSNYEQAHCKEIIQKYLDERNELDITMKESSSGNDQINLYKGQQWLLCGTYLEIMRHLGIKGDMSFTMDLKNEQEEKYIYDAIREWAEELKREQIKVTLEKQLEEFMDIEDLQNEDWFDTDNAVYHVEHDLKERLPHYEALDRLHDHDLLMMNQVSLEEINRQYQIISPEKELEKGGFLK